MCIIASPMLCFQPNETSSAVKKAYHTRKNRPTPSLPGLNGVCQLWLYEQRMQQTGLCMAWCM